MKKRVFVIVCSHFDVKTTILLFWVTEVRFKAWSEPEKLEA